MQENYWESAFNSLPDCVSFHTTDRRVIKVNQAVLDHSNKSIGNIIGRKCYEVYFNRFEPCQSCPLEDTLEDFKSHSTETFYNNKYYLITIGPIFENDQLIGVIHAVKDITQRVYAEEKYSTLVENMNDGVVISDRELNILFINNSIERISGYTKDEFLSESLMRLVTPASLDVIINKNIELDDETEGSFQLELQGIHKDGRIVDLILSSSIFNDRIISVITDLTDLKSKEVEINQLKNRIRIGEILVDNRSINLDQLKRALKIKQKKIGEILIESGVLTSEALERALKKQRELNNEK